jgi:peroxisome-assembly ATPase
MRSNHDYRKPLNNDDPSGYFLQDQSGWDETCTHVLSKLVPPTTLTVYSRSIPVPTIGVTGAAKFNFSELCGANLGPADYLTIASTFPILIIDNVPVLTLTKKNEARRFITLLDALYECRVKLLIRASSPPESLFFPDADTVAEDDLLWTEAFTKAHLDMTNPYRPNIVSYTGRNEEEVVVGVSLVDRPVDSTRLSAFTGEDERFAFRRAVSRLFEMPSKRWWEGQTRLPMKELSWSKSNKQGGGDTVAAKSVMDSEGMDREGRGFRHAASPFRGSNERPPSFWDGHFWGVMRWGRRAGRWGMGLCLGYVC